MSRVLALDDIVTEFLLNTCRPCLPSTRRSEHVAYAALYFGLLATPDNEVDTELHHIPLTTGSVAEFYIEPILPLYGDIDVMHHRDNQLAIPRGHPPPTQLPAEFHNYVQVWEIIDRVPNIIDSHFPGYMYLELRYLLTECGDDDHYNAEEYDRGTTGTYLTNEIYGDVANIHGPALLVPASDESPVVSFDAVLCVRCLSWPSQAADWPTRHRNYGWPDSATCLLYTSPSPRD